MGISEIEGRVQLIERDHDAVRRALSFIHSTINLSVFQNQVIFSTKI